MKQKFKVFNIKYLLEDEDTEDLTKEEIKELANELHNKSEMIIDIDNEYRNNEELEDMLCEEISNKSGYLVCGFNYEMIK